MSVVPRKRLPLVQTIRRSSLLSDGSRVGIVPADVNGRFTRARKVAFALLIVIWLALPTIPVNGHPAVFLDVRARAFFLFGKTFNAQDIWLLFFVLTTVLFSVVTLTALAGRVYCGFACPQTVFLEGVYRPLERLVLGSRDARRRRDRSGGSERVVRAGLLHVIYVVTSLAIANFFVGYFVSMPGLAAMVRQSPAAHPEAFGWMVAVAALFYANFAFFREQMCLVVCPYGRMQSVLFDEDTKAIGYDAKRGEPRGHLHAEKDADKPAEKLGDCVDCDRCVSVCPTGIDIRNGLQVDCVSCGACIDACNDVMARLGRPLGLVRYDSLNGLAGRPRRIVRGHLLAYAGVTLLALTGGIAAAGSRKEFEANLLRLRGAPYSIENGVVQNAFEVHLVNKTSKPRTYELHCTSPGALTFTPSSVPLEVRALDERRVPLFVRGPTGTGDLSFAVGIHVDGASVEAASLKGKFLAPGAKVGP